MRDTGLVLVAVYSGASFIYADVAHDEFARLEVAMKSAQRFGATFFVVGGGAIRAEGPRDADYEALAKSLDRVVGSRQDPRIARGVPSASGHD